MQPMNTHDPSRQPALSRRQFLGAAGSLAAVAAMAGCSSSGGSAAGSAATTTGAGTTGSAPASTIAATTTAAPTTTAVTTTTTAAGSLTDIEHVVVLFQENRSFDHYFGTRQGVAGFASAAADQAYRNPFPAHPDGYLLPYRFDTSTTAGACGPDPDHSWDAQHRAWNDGANDGFATAMGPHALGYFTRADLPYYWALADEFTLCDQYFCSVLGPTNPNRHVAMTGTIDPSGTGGGPAIDNSGVAYTWETYPERLQAAGVTWRVYHEVDDYDDNNLKFFTQFQGLAAGNPLYDNALVNRSADAFEIDAANGDLPQVSWLVAPAAISEHPSWAPAVGEDFTARKIAAVMNNPELWATTVFILSYDENGGFFDHVAPPVPPAGTTDEFVNGAPIGLGFRVPTIVVSPWTRRAKDAAPAGGAVDARVNSTVFDHTSILRFLETRFGVDAPLVSAWRRETCGDLSEVLDLGAFDPTVPALPATAERAAAMASGCGALPPAAAPVVQVPAAVET